MEVINDVETLKRLNAHLRYVITTKNIEINLFAKLARELTDLWLNFSNSLDSDYTILLNNLDENLQFTIDKLGIEDADKPPLNTVIFRFREKYYEKVHQMSKTNSDIRQKHNETIEHFQGQEKENKRKELGYSSKVNDVEMNKPKSENKISLFHQKKMTNRHLVSNKTTPNLSQKMDLDSFTTEVDRLQSIIARHNNLLNVY